MSPDRYPRVELLGSAALIAAAATTVVVAFPAEGRVLAPLHAGVEALLGKASFLLPVGLVFVGVMLLVHQRRPDLRLPIRRLVGLGLLAIAVLPTERLLGSSTGLVGEWLADFMLGTLGRPLTIVIFLVLVAVGAILALRVELPRLARAPR
jgi:hypothetical protein